MKNNQLLTVFRMLFFIILMGVSSVLYAKSFAIQSSVLGDWQTFDATSKKPASIITLYRKGDFVFGKVTKIYPINGAKSTDICVACHGEQHNKRILGLTVINKMICSDGRCHGGKILDPRDGKIYKSKMQIVGKGYYLNVRGYVGIPLFGKTVTWRRMMKQSA